MFIYDSLEGLTPKKIMSNYIHALTELYTLHGTLLVVMQYIGWKYYKVHVLHQILQKFSLFRLKGQSTRKASDAYVNVFNEHS